MKTLTTIGGLLLFFLILSFSGCSTVGTGERGVKTRFGEVISKPLPEGLYFYNSITTDMVTFNVKSQIINNEMESYTKDMQQSKIKVAVNYNLEADKVDLLLKSVGKDYEEIVIQPKVASITKNILGAFEADKLIANRELVASKIRDSLSAELLSYNIYVQSVVFVDISFAEEFEKAIEAKQIATQEAIKAQNYTKQVEEEAKQKVLIAKAEAEAMQIKSEALSKNQNLVSYEAVLKWDGKLPVNMYGSAPVPFIKID